MAWEAILKSVNVVQGEAVVVITFQNKGSVFDKTYRIGSPGDDFIRKQAAQELRNLEALDAWVDSVRLGTIDLASIAPTQEQIDADLFFAMLRKLNNLKDSIAKGLSKADNLPALEAEVKAAFKDEYTSDQRWQK